MTIAVIGASIAMLFFAVQPVAGQDVPVLSDTKRRSIVENCSTIRTSLSQLHTNDSLPRVNRGQIYASLSSDFMAKLNSRIALNRLDASDLVSVTTQYESHHADFRVAYQEYSDELLALMRIRCDERPDAFYAKLLEVRQKRTTLHQSVKQLNGDIAEYTTAFSEFRADYMKQEVANE